MKHFELLILYPSNEKQYPIRFHFRNKNSKEKGNNGTHLIIMIVFTARIIAFEPVGAREPATVAAQDEIGTVSL
jgi:hypothetical protein